MTAHTCAARLSRVTSEHLRLHSLHFTIGRPRSTIIALHCTSYPGEMCQIDWSQCLLAARPRLDHAKVDQVIKQSGTWKSRCRVRNSLDDRHDCILTRSSSAVVSVAWIVYPAYYYLPTSVVPLSCCTHAIECTNAPPCRDLTMYLHLASIPSATSSLWPRPHLALSGRPASGQLDA